MTIMRPDRFNLIRITLLLLISTLGIALLRAGRSESVEAAAVTGAEAAPAQGFPIFWDGDAGDNLWQTKENWVGDQLPQPGDDVRIGSGFSVTLSSSGVQTIGSLVCDGSLTITNGARLEFSSNSQINGTLTIGNFDPPMVGTLHGTVATAPTMTIAGPFNWIGGELSGGGVFNANGGIMISGNQGVALRGPTLNNTGTATWTGMGDIGIGSAGSSEGRFNNFGTFTVFNTESFFLLGVAQGFFNEGNFVKITGGTTTFSNGVPFHNPGTASISGILELRGGGTSTGSFNINSGELQFTAGNYQLNNGTTITSTAGIGLVNGAIVTVSGNVTASRFALTSGTLEGAGTLTVSNLLVWTGGTMTGTGVTNANGTMDISGDGGKELFVRTLNNAGTATWTDRGNIGMGGGAVFNNTGTFNAEEDGASFIHTGGTPASFNNSGDFNKLVSERSTFFSGNVAFNNTGTVTLESASLLLAGSGTTVQPGAFDARAGKGVTINGGNYVLDNAAFFGQGSFLINIGTVEVRGTVAMSNFILQSGTLTGAGTLDIFGTFRWTSGTMAGSGVTNADGMMDILFSIGKTLQQRTLNARGNVKWSNLGNIGMLLGATFNNFGNFTAENDQFFGVVGAESGRFNNFGTFSKSGGSGTTTFRVPFVNSGLAVGTSGTIFFFGGYNQREGSLFLDAGDTSGTLDLQGGSLEGDGSHTGNVNNSGCTASPGTSPGTINITGNYTQGAAGVLHIEIGGLAPGAQFDLLNVSSTASLGGSLNIAFINGFTPNIGDTFTFLLASSRAGSFRQLNFPNVTGRAFNIIYNSNNVTLEVVSPVPVTVPTPAGSNVRVQAGAVTLTFDLVTQPGMTTVNPIDPFSAGSPPAGLTLPANTPAYEITTNAVYSGQITVDVRLPYDIQPNRPRLALLHGEPALIDRTIDTNDLSKLSARVLSLSPFVIAQADSCISTISPAVCSFAASGGNGAVDVSAPTDCSWTAQSNDSWISVTTASGTGDGALSYEVAANSTTSIRSGSISISGQRFTVLQGAAFLDVPESHPFYTEIGKLSARGVTLGCDASNYCPELTVTRQQMAAFLIRALGDFNPPQPQSQRFNDVPPANPFYVFIEEMAVRQITLGCGGGNYCPSDPVLRDQMAAFIIRALGDFNPPEPAAQRFLDVPPTNPFYSFIEQMALRGITLGCGGGNYCPSLEVSRGQMAAFLVRAFGL